MASPAEPLRLNGWRRLRACLALALACAGALVRAEAGAVEVSSRYRSPRNPERAVRETTELIVLHTTEAPARSSLNKLSERGEAHYCVTEEGTIYAIVDRDREAFHAGRSMWNGKEDVDKFSLGIECVGYHDQPMSRMQLNAIRDLVHELQRMYRIPDARVVCHSHVAYGSPNKWQKSRHRGRKRCGMLFAMASVRSVLGLRARPKFDPDTRARRLVVGDDYLCGVLYGRTDTMAAAYPPPSVPAKPTPPKLVASSKPASPKPASAKSAPAKSAPPASVAELQARGYVLLGSITPTQTASRLAGGRWNAADTFYTIRNKVISGCDIDAAHIEKGMRVWRKK